MRIWDIDPSELCRQHLLGEHRELHAIWAVLTKGKTGYRNHPETLRWDGRLAALYKRHDAEVVEMFSRGYNHKSPLDKALAIGSKVQSVFLSTEAEQRDALKAKHNNFED